MINITQCSVSRSCGRAEVTVVAKLGKVVYVNNGASNNAKIDHFYKHCRTILQAGLITASRDGITLLFFFRTLLSCLAAFKARSLAFEHEMK